MIACYCMWRLLHEHEQAECWHDAWKADCIGMCMIACYNGNHAFFLLICMFFLGWSACCMNFAFMHDFACPFCLYVIVLISIVHEAGLILEWLIFHKHDRNGACVTLTLHAAWHDLHDILHEMHAFKWRSQGLLWFCCMTRGMSPALVNDPYPFILPLLLWFGHVSLFFHWMTPFTEDAMILYLGKHIFGWDAEEFQCYISLS